MKLKKNIKQFKLHDTYMIGNPETAHVIGLTQDGRNIIHDITNNNIIDNDLLNRNKDLLLAMQKYGYFDIDQDEEQINNTETTKKLVSAYIHVTDRCNLHCVGCYSLVNERNKNSDLATKEINYIIKELINEGVRELIISGGELLLRKDLPEICKEAKRNGIEKLNLISNGTMEFELYENIIPFIDDLAISVDGYNSEVSFIRDKGIMGKVLDTLKKCKNKIDTKFIVTLHKKNINCSYKYVELSKELEISFTFSILTVDNKLDIYKELILTREDFVNMTKGIEEGNIPVEECNLECKISCGSGKTMVSIDATGNVYPCHMLHNTQFKMGNIFKNNLRELLNSDKNLMLDLNVDKLTKCKECDYKYICSGGCRARAYLETGDLLEVDSTCILSKKSVDLFFKGIN